MLAKIHFIILSKLSLKLTEDYNKLTMYQKSDQSLYQSLIAKGLKIHELEFYAIYAQLQKGIIETKSYLKANTLDDPQLSFNNDTGRIGFNTQTNTINISLDYLSHMAASKTSLEYKDQLICFVPDKFCMVIKYLDWLRFFGIEQAIHFYQFHNNPSLKVSFPEKFPDKFSPKSLLLSNLEVEARKTVDMILIENQEKPIWHNLDTYLKTNFPEFYNKSITELSNLPKPNLQITFEMENLFL